MFSYSSRAFWEIHSLVYGVKVSAQVHKDLQEDIVRELRIRPGQRLLDAGIGTGALELALLRCNLSDVLVTGVDFSVGMLRKAKSALQDSFLGLVLVKADLDAPLPFPNDSFDRVASCNTLYALRNQSGFLKELHRVLRPSGRLVLATPHEKFAGIEVMRYGHKKARGFWQHSKALGETVLCLLLVLPFEFFISLRQRRGEYRCLDEQSLQTLLAEFDFSSIRVGSSFAGQNLLVTAVK